MTPQFHPFLVNTPFGDPALFIDFLFERRAILFDLGDLGQLTPRKLLRISHVFISHTHVDHFIGFDQLVRLCLGRDKKLHCYGPPGFVAQVGHRLAAYSWNLVQNYPTDFTIVAVELHDEGRAFAAEFHCRDGFRRSGDASFAVAGGVLLEEENFLVRTTFLDHKIPCLAFCLEEKNHVNIMKNRLEELGLPVGEWLVELKRAVLRGAGDDTGVRAWWREGAEIHERFFTLGALKKRVLIVVAGQKIAYVTDAVYSPGNRARIVELARHADYLFIEATFLDMEAERARERCHLTARQAGSLAREAGALRVTPFHFSAKYSGEGSLLQHELEEAFGERRP
jgi:ribonuclease Z